MKISKTLASLLLFSGAAYGQVTVNWGQNSFGVNITDSSGGDLNDSSTLLFELGVFDAGFDPAAQPFSAWAGAWNVLSSPDQAVTGSVGGQIGGSFTFGPASGAGAGNIQSGAAPFTDGSQLYIWGVVGGKANQMLTGGTQDWVLFSNSPSGVDTIEDGNWIIPDTQSTNFGTDHGSGARTLEASTADLNVIGTTGMNGDIQFAAVPEPSSVMLLSLFAGFGLIRRRR